MKFRNKLLISLIAGLMAMLLLSLIHILQNAADSFLLPTQVLLNPSEVALMEIPSCRDPFPEIVQQII